MPKTRCEGGKRRTKTRGLKEMEGRLCEREDIMAGLRMSEACSVVAAELPLIKYVTSVILSDGAQV